jgi:hypothetical protein
MLFVSRSLAVAREASRMMTPRMTPTWHSSRMRQTRLASPRAWYLAVWVAHPRLGGKSLCFLVASHSSWPAFDRRLQRWFSSGHFS